MNLEPKTVENVDAISHEILTSTEKKLGIIPNMYVGMAHNTALLDGYTAAYNSFRANSGFTPQEQEVIFLSIAFENECEYCMAAHSFVADTMTHVPTEVTDAIRNNATISDKKLRALSIFSKKVTSKRGFPTEEEISDFINAGYAKKDILGVIAAIGVKTMSNYFNHIFETPVDDAFKNRLWSK